MASEITTRQCPACTGPLHFVGASGKLECDYCGAKYDVAEIEALYAEKDEKAAETGEKAAEQAEKAAEQQAPTSDWDFSKTGSDWGTDAEKVRVYSCPSCGAELLCDATTAATSCPYCGNNTIIPGQLGGALKPDYVIPFKLNQQEAIAALKKHYKKKILLPRAFTNNNHIQEIKGVYVPFWLFDGQAHAAVDFNATKSISYRQGDYRITDTKHFICHRAGSVAFERIPVDASSKMPDNHMDSIEPFDYKELKPFATSYLPGYLADKYDVTAKQSTPRADHRAAESAVEALAATVTGYDTCREKNRAVRLTGGKVSYAMLPVWMLHTKWQDKEFLFAMNGQTGRLVGDLPASMGRLFALAGSVYAGCAILIALACLLF